MPKEAKHPSEIDDETDLPQNIQKALPDGGEQDFIKYLHQAMDEYPDEPEGEWWSRAWDKINDEYSKDYDDAGSSWEKNEESNEFLDRADRFMERTSTMT